MHLLIIPLVFLIYYSHSECIDGVNNIITAESYGEEILPVQVKNVSILVYDINYKPSCQNGRPNVVLPGYFHIRSGVVDTSKSFDLFDSGMVKASISLNGKSICVDGKSDMIVVPNKFCHFEITSFFPHNVCALLQEKGHHTLEELESKLQFNSTLELPPSPSFLGISLLDLLSGDYRIKISIESHHSKIVQFTIPAQYEPLQMGL